MATFLASNLPYLLPLAVGVGAFVYYRMQERLTPDRALSQAINMAWKFWNLYSFRAPAVLTKKDIPYDELREAGMVLKDLIVHEVQDGVVGGRLAAPHPELSKVDPVAIASGVAQIARQAGLGEEAPTKGEVSHD